MNTPPINKRDQSTISTAGAPGPSTTFGKTKKPPFGNTNNGPTPEQVRQNRENGFVININ
jgi:hypothetical protein